MQSLFEVILDNIPAIGFGVFIAMAMVMLTCMYSFGTEKIELLFTKIQDFKWPFFIYIILVGLFSISHTDLWLFFHFLVIGFAILVLFLFSEVSLEENLELLGWQKRTDGTNHKDEYHHKARAKISTPTGVAKYLPAGMSSSANMVEIFYGTDRQTTGSTQSSEFYGGKRGTLVFGTCKVSIPLKHEQGELEAPFGWWIFKFPEDTQKHVVLRNVSPISEECFFSNLTARIEKSDQKQAFVYIHGYNVTFEDAARRTAQMAYDLGFDGAPIFYSWPSQGKPISLGIRYFNPYTTDETNVEWSIPNLKKFLSEISSNTNANTIHLIAHSMGNRALTAALRKIASEQREIAVFKEIVLAAPDIDAEIFKRDIVPEILQENRRITLYASSNDEALKQSKEVHTYSRAGDSGDKIVIVPGMDTIDASAVDTSLTGHSYIGDSPPVLIDLSLLLKLGLSPGDRNLLVKWYDNAKYWMFRH